MQFLEVYGIKKISEYYHKLESQKRTNETFHSIKDLFASNHLYVVTIFAFIVGAGLTFPVIWLELKLDIFNFDHIDWINIFLYVLALIVLVGLEFYFLFLLGFYSIAFHIYHLQHIEEMGNGHIDDEEFLRVFSRTIMELPEPKENTRKYNINHHEISNRDIVIFSILYKVKVVVSNFVLKFVARKVLTRTSFRVYSPYIATVGTGAWDAFVLYKSIKYSQYKIMVRYTIDQLLKHQEILFQDDNNIKAILARYYHYSEYNNNFDYFLASIYSIRPFEYDKEMYLAQDVFDKCSPKLLSLLYSFKAEINSRREKEIIRQLGITEEIKKIRNALKAGNTTYLNEYILQMT